MSPAAPCADSALERQQLGLLPLALLVLVQGERRDLEYSLLWASQLTDREHARHDRVMGWFRTLGLLEAGAPHFGLTRRGRVALAALRAVARAEPATAGNLGGKLRRRRSS